MTDTTQQLQPRAPESDTTMALVVYVLNFISYFTGFTSLVGVIIAYVKIGDADPMLQTHYRFQIRTFWIGLLYLVVGFVLTMVLVGIAILFWWFVWSLVRNIKGVIALSERKPIADPGSWMFG
jgi:uncharacterized membrane protein